MLLQALNEFYKRATRDGLIKEAAFTEKYIRWTVPLKSDGTLEGIGLQEVSVEKDEEGRSNFPMFRVPKTARAKKGREAEFLVDGIDSVFGFHPDPEKPKNEEMLKKKHEDFWLQVEEGFKETNSKMLEALLNFRRCILNKENVDFLQWKSLKESEKPNWIVKTSTGSEEKIKSGDSFTFTVDGYLLINDEKVREFWRNRYKSEVEAKSESAEIGVCLVTGEENTPLVASHIPPIRVPGGQPSGSYLVSFQESSFSSYGKTQSYNSPVSFQAVEGYLKALDYLVSNPNHSLKIGNTKLIFWADKSDTDWVTSFFEADEKIISDFMKKPFAGDSFLPKLLDDKFYSVTLMGNSGRIVVRHWMQMSVRQAIKNFHDWFNDLSIQTFGYSNTQDSGRPLSLYRLASSTIRKSDSRKKKDEEKFLAEIQTELYRTALEGKVPSLFLAKRIINRVSLDLAKWGVEILKTPTPPSLLQKISEAKEPFPPISQSRFALLKLIVNRNSKENEPMIEKELTDIDDAAYVCGRLFAVLDELQREALATKEIRDGKEFWKKFDGAGVIEKFYGSASTSPAIAFPYLIRLHQHHLKKLAQAERKWLERQFVEKIAKIMGQLKDKKFPSVLPIKKQGYFALGFYQQIAADHKEIEERVAKKKLEKNQQTEIFEEGEQTINE